MAGVFDYGKMTGIAGKLLTQFNQGTIVLIVETPGTGPASDPGQPTRTSYTLKGTVNGVPSQFIQRGLANEGDLQVTAAVHATAPDPKPGNIISVDGVEYRVVAPSPIPGAGVKVVWKYIIRR